MNKFLTAGLLFIAFLLIYYAGSFSKIPFADCVGFALTTELDTFETVASSTSHILYSNTAILINKLAGLGSIESNRCLVIFSAAFAVAFVYMTVRNLTKINWAAIVAAIVFGFSFTFWKNAEIIEVYTYNAFWLTLFYLCVINSFVLEKKKAYIILAGIFLGISIWLHIQNFLLIPAYLLLLFYFRAEKAGIIYSFIAFSVIFSLLFIVNYSQGYPLSSPFSSNQGHWVEESFKKTFSQYLMDIVKSVVYLLYNFTVFVIVGIIGIIMLYKDNRKMFNVFLLASVLIYGFATFYAVTDNYIFFLPFNIIFALAIGYGLTSGKYLFFKKLSWICLFIPAFYYLFFSIALYTPQGKAFDNFKSYKGGLSYYMLPWMCNNKGILEFVIDKKTAPEPINWMTYSANIYIKKLKEKGYTEEEIRKF
ncbi:Protein of unknown function [Chryseobacterium taichungense]|uniref:DUF2723 domain-containing protein n=1 Tax=Chryseobacterium taichungense TaxID=295069 RepID=A0A1H7WCJ6_9FLAO|nr:DUF2723 domain-containing protein [Chryseobacterium taichungense]SEM19243.1 Protein of unknown function [Chryseobacterium taichungense]